MLSDHCQVLARIGGTWSTIHAPIATPCADMSMTDDHVAIAQVQNDQSIEIEELVGGVDPAVRDGLVVLQHEIRQ